MLLDGANPTIAGSVLSAAALVGQAHGASVRSQQLSLRGPAGNVSSPVDVRTRVLYNPDLLGSYNIVPGLVAMILFQTATSLTALAIVKERERGTIEQLIVTPIRSWELIVAKIIPYILVSFANTILIMAVGTFLFGVPIARQPCAFVLAGGSLLTAHPRAWAVDLHCSAHTTTGPIDDHADHAAIHDAIGCVLSHFLPARISSDGRQPFAAYLFCLYLAQHCY